MVVEIGIYFRYVGREIGSFSDFDFVCACDVEKISGLKTELYAFVGLKKRQRRILYKKRAVRKAGLFDASYRGGAWEGFPLFLNITGGNGEKWRKRDSHQALEAFLPIFFQPTQMIHTAAEEFVDREGDPDAVQPHLASDSQDICQANAANPTGENGNDGGEMDVARGVEPVLSDMVHAAPCLDENIDKEDIRVSEHLFVGVEEETEHGARA